MTGKKDLLGKQFQDLYSPYYKNHGNFLLKREISAIQTVDRMARVLANRGFDKLLDVGAGDGNVLLQLDGRGIARELFAVEVSDSGIEAIKSRKIPLLFDARLFDGYKIPYPDKYFDLAIAIHVLEHVEHERLFLKEISRVSRHAYIEVPLEHGFKIRRSIEDGKKYGHINFYTKDTLRNTIESSGMKVVESGVFASSLKYEQHLSGQFNGRIKNFIRKSALLIAPDLAPWFLVYNCYAYCESN
jgi:SAM-dependent methyltransferase